MTFLSELALKRNSNVSNVFLLQTFDPKRISQMLNAVRDRQLDQLFKKQYTKLLLFDLQTQEIINIEDNSIEQLDMMASPTQQLLAVLRNQPTILIVKYVLEQRHAQFLSDFLAACSHDDKLYNNKSTVIVFTCDSSLFPTPLLRLVHTIEIVPSTIDEREELLKNIAEQLMEGFKEYYNGELNIEITPDLVQSSSGLTLHDVETAALESFFETRKFTVEKMTEYKIKILREYGIQYIIPKRGFETVGGYDYLKKYVQNRVIKVLRKPKIAKKYGLSVPRGILLYGPPGTGKSWFAKALSKEIGLPMISISPADFLRGIVGETEARVRQITRLIESLSPVIVFIDEFDQLTLSRESMMMTDSGVSRRMQNMLLDWLGSEERKSFIVGATNLVEQIDSAFLRPGRLDEVIPVLPPDAEAREAILKVHCNSIRKIPVKDVNFKDLAKRTYLWTGAEIEKLCIEAASIAMEDTDENVTMKHFEEALKTIDVNIQEREGKLRRMIMTLKRLENVNQRFLKEALKLWAKKETDETRVRGLLQSLK